MLGYLILAFMCGMLVGAILMAGSIAIGERTNKP